MKKQRNVWNEHLTCFWDKERKINSSGKDPHLSSSLQTSQHPKNHFHRFRSQVSCLYQYSHLSQLTVLILVPGFSLKTVKEKKAPDFLLLYPIHFFMHALTIYWEFIFLWVYICLFPPPSSVYLSFTVLFIFTFLLTFWASPEGDNRIFS